MTATTLPELEYPNLYTFRVIGRSSPGLREHILQLVRSVLPETADDSLSERPSREGTYLAFQIRCYLQNEDQRRDIYKQFQGNDRIVYVL